MAVQIMGGGTCDSIATFSWPPKLEKRAKSSQLAFQVARGSTPSMACSLGATAVEVLQGGSDDEASKVSSGHNFEPRRLIQNREHRYNPPIKALVQSHVANRLKLLCHSERFWTNERATKLDL